MGQGQQSPSGSGWPYPRGLSGIAYGGDYAPEQWPEQVWTEDVALMREAGVNLVSIGIFSWVLMEPREGEYTFGWLDRVMELLHDNGIRVDLGTPSAVPPAWFTKRYPSARLVDRSGHVLGQGGRQSFCPNSPEYARASANIAEQLGRRYAGHPALALWHVHNEFAGVNAHCYCDTCAQRFRDWLLERHGDLDALNEAWGTTFWGQCYGEWSEIDPPRVAPTAINPAQQLDYLRFCSDTHLANFRRERDLLRAVSPGVPITTNFQIANCKWLDYWKWGGEVDIVSNDHYLQPERADSHIELAMCADLTRSLAGGAPWLLMEHSTSAVNWRHRNIAKRPGELARNSMAHVARGADGVLFFQWRASRFGAEKFHSAMLPQGGTDTRIWREVSELGARLGELDGLRGTRVAADVAIVWDWESWWALELDWRPSVDLAFRERVEAYYEQLWRAHHTVDFVHPEGDLGAYRLVVAPSLYLTTPAGAKNLGAYVAGGGNLLVSYFSGIVDANDTVPAGAYPGGLRDLLGVVVEEFLPLRAGETVQLSGGGSADVWAEDVKLAGAQAVLSYADGPAAGGPAVTRNASGNGSAWYVSTRLSGADLRALLDQVCAEAGLTDHADLPDSLELVHRPPYRIAINHGTRGVPVDGVTVPAGAVTVTRTA